MANILPILFQSLNERLQKQQERSLKPLDILELQIKHQQLKSLEKDRKAQRLQEQEEENRRVQRFQHEKEQYEYENAPIGDVERQLFRQSTKIDPGPLPRKEARQWFSSLVSRSRSNETLDLREQTRLDSIIKSFNSNPNTRKNQEMINSSQNARELALSNNPLADNAIPTFLARASGEVGNLALHDREPFGGSQQIITRIKRISFKLTKGLLDDEDRQYVLKLVDTYEKSSNRNLTRMAQQQSNKFSKAMRGKVSEEELFSWLHPMGEFPTSETVNPLSKFGARKLP